MPGYLTTHVLDAVRGCPAEGLTISLHYIGPRGREAIAIKTTNADGRTDDPILPEDQFTPGIYELTFNAGDYLRSTGQVPADEQYLFLDTIPIRFGMTEGHYHVPLLLSPHAYSTYRGS